MDILQRKKEFTIFHQQRFPILVNFLSQIGFQDAEQSVLNAEIFVQDLSDYLGSQSIQEEDKEWLSLVLGYYIGELIIQKYNGSWFLDDEEDSPTYGAFVIGNLAQANSAIVLNPLEVAKRWLNQKNKQTFKKLVLSLTELIKKNS